MCFFQISYIPSCGVARVQVSSSALPGSDAMIFEALTGQHLLSILEEDFIELDDLMR